MERRKGAERRVKQKRKISGGEKRSGQERRKGIEKRALKRGYWPIDGRPLTGDWRPRKRKRRNLKQQHR